MVPSKLILKNFMCYREAQLDLEGIHLACLSGDNGAGKSALLDAITWALWGKARASADELVAQGEVEMQIDFEFKINEELYRVIRYRTRKGAGQSQLTFQIAAPDSTWRNISGSTQRATQDEIIKALRMEYETFINSAFLLQGRADEFTTKSPTDRKKVLSEILGLSYYDELEAKAKEESKEAEIRRRRLDERLGEIDKELANRPTFERQKTQAEQELALSREMLTQNETEVNALQGRESALRGKEEQRQSYLKRLESDRRDLAQANRRLEEINRDIERCQTVLDRREQIESGYRAFQELDKQHELLLGKFHRYQQLIEQRRSLEKSIERARTMLEADQRSFSRDLKEADEQSRSLPALEKEGETLQKEIAEATRLGIEWEQHKDKRQEKLAEQKSLAEEIKRLDKLLKEIEQKAKQVPAAGERCDHCGTLLDEAARDHTIQERRKEYSEQKDKRKDYKQQYETLADEVTALESGIAKLEGPARRLLDLKGRAGGIEQKLLTAQRAGQKASQAQSELEKIGSQLEREDFSQAERTNLGLVAKQMQELAYSDETRQQVKSKLDSLKKFEQEKNALDTAQERIIILKGDARQQTQRQTELKQSEAENHAQVEALALEVAGLAELTAQLRVARERKNEAETKVKIYQKQVWDAESELKRCDKLAEEKKLKTVEFTEAARQQDIYKALAEAFGKKGVQAMIIETALPELEDEANKLLGRITDGRMTVRFETIGNTKKGDAIETLDLKISDESGVRSYELFSGGEAFRVNFAVRVALSKLLARRSGAALRTLVIDEGFGTQDGTGRERLIEAIRSIESEFERVLVITHIQELKDVFPVRIDVVKTANGSTLSVN